MSKLFSLWSWLCRFKYFVVLFFFAFVVGYLDDDSFYDRWQRQQRLDQCRQEIANYKARYEYDVDCLNDLETNPMTAERLGRERYYMHRPGEDVFVIHSAEPVYDPSAPVSEPSVPVATPVAADSVSAGEAEATPTAAVDTLPKSLP
ncbi:MAG: septum formation initiator family protein [Bacteroidaceae bacterium]|nr:septum formation initiator family protein [Bacteroidaceae bacterium]